MKGDTGDNFSGVSGVIDLQQMLADLTSGSKDKKQNSHKDEKKQKEIKHYDESNETKNSKNDDKNCNNMNVPFTELSNNVGTLNYKDDEDNWISGSGFFVNYNGNKYFLTSSRYVDAYNYHIGKDEQTQNGMNGKIIVTVRSATVLNFIGVVTYNSPRMDVCMIEFPGQSLDAVGAFDLYEGSPQVGMNAHIIGYQHRSMHGYLSGNVSSVNVNKDDEKFGLENRMILSIPGDENGPRGSPIIHQNCKNEWVVLGMCYQDEIYNERFMTGTTNRYLESFLMRAVYEKESLPREELMVKFIPNEDEPINVKLCPLNHKNPTSDDGCYHIDNYEADEGDIAGEKILNLPRDYYLLVTDENEGFKLEIRDLYNQYSSEWVKLYEYDEDLVDKTSSEGFRDLLRTDVGFTTKAEKVVSLALFSETVDGLAKPSVSIFNDNKKLNTNQLLLSDESNVALNKGVISAAYANVEGPLTLKKLLALVEETVGSRDCSCDYDICKLQKAVIDFYNKNDVSTDLSDPEYYYDEQLDNVLNSDFAKGGSRNQELVNHMAAVAGELNNGYGYHVTLTKCIDMGSNSVYDIKLGEDHEHYLNLVGFRINMNNDKLKSGMEINRILEAIGVKMSMAETNKNGQLVTTSEGFDEVKANVLQSVYTFKDHPVLVVENTSKKLVLQVKFCNDKYRTITYQVDSDSDTEIIFNTTGTSNKHFKGYQEPNEESLSKKVFVNPKTRGAVILTVNNLTNKDDSTVAVANATVYDLSKVIYQNKIIKLQYVKYDVEGAEELAFWTGTFTKGLIKLAWTGVSDSDIFDSNDEIKNDVMETIVGTKIDAQTLQTFDEYDFTKFGYRLSNDNDIILVNESGDDDDETFVTGLNEPDVAIFGQEYDDTKEALVVLDSKYIKSDIAKPDEDVNDRTLWFAPYHQIYEIVTGARYINIDASINEFSKVAFMPESLDNSMIGNLNGVEIKANGVLSRNAERRLFGSLPRGKVSITNLKSGEKLKKSKFDESIWDTLVNETNDDQTPEGLIWSGLMVSELELCPDGTINVKDTMKHYSFIGDDNAIAALSFASESGQLLYKALSQGLKVKAHLTFRCRAYKKKGEVERYSLYKGVFDDEDGEVPPLNVEIKHNTFLKLTKYTFREESRMNIENKLDYTGNLIA